MLEPGQLTYCSACGAPQIFLSEELQEQAAEGTRNYSERAAAAAQDPEPEMGAAPAGRLRRARSRGANRWAMAVEYALLSSGIAAALGVGALVFPSLLLLDWIWMVSAPILTVSFYNTRSAATQSTVRAGAGNEMGTPPGTSLGTQSGTPSGTRLGTPLGTPLGTHLRGLPEALSPGFAARLGLLTGLLVLASSAAVFTLGMVLARFALGSHGVDTELAAAFAQVRTTTEAQYGPAAAPIIRMLGIPEFRVGFLLWMVAVSSALYLLLAGVSAGATGLLLSRRRVA